MSEHPQARVGRVDPAMLLGVDGVTEAVFVRHAQQERFGHFLDDAVADQRDPPLSELGQRQAQATARVLRGQAIDAICSSPSTRAIDTAAVIAAEVGLPVRVVPGIEEFGMFRDLPGDRSPREALGDVGLAGFQHRWARTHAWRAWPASEPVDEFLDRVITGIDGILGLHKGQRVVVVTHGGCINAYLGDVLGTRDDLFVNPAHGSISRLLAKRDRRVVSTLNELQHLMEPDDLLTY
jgi:probable phosphoglycerate mutase